MSLKKGTVSKKYLLEQRQQGKSHWNFMFYTFEFDVFWHKRVGLKNWTMRFGSGGGCYALIAPSRVVGAEHSQGFLWPTWQLFAYPFYEIGASTVLQLGIPYRNCLWTQEGKQCTLLSESDKRPPEDDHSPWVWFLKHNRNRTKKCYRGYWTIYSEPQARQQFLLHRQH